jgi:hypothetical protein
MNYSLRIEIDNSKSYINDNSDVIKVLRYSEFSIIAVNESDRYCHCHLYYNNILIEDAMTTILPYDKLKMSTHHGNRLSFEQNDTCVIAGIFSPLHCDETTKNSDVKLSIFVEIIDKLNL